MKKEFLIIADYNEAQKPLSINEVAEICQISPDMIIEFVAYEIIRPHGKHPTDWLFELNELTRLHRALRLRHDLEINLPGIAIILDLLDEVEALRNHLNNLENQL